MSSRPAQASEVESGASPPLVALAQMKHQAIPRWSPAKSCHLTLLAGTGKLAGMTLNVQNSDGGAQWFPLSFWAQPSDPM